MKPIFSFQLKVTQQRTKITKTYYKNCGSATATYRALRGDDGLHNRPNTQEIYRKRHFLAAYFLVVAIPSRLATKIMRFDTFRPFLWDNAKDRVYAEKPSILEHLKTNIRQVMAETPLNIC